MFNSYVTFNREGSLSEFVITRTHTYTHAHAHTHTPNTPTHANYTPTCSSACVDVW